jgi:release factor glutamine methyltransferase
MTAAENARANGYGDHLVAVCLLSALAPVALFDVIMSSPPSFPGEPRIIADRACHVGPNYRDIAPLFDQARDRLAPGRHVYFLVSSDSSRDLLSALIIKARFHARLVAERSILIESLIIYELEAL